jgi:Mg-chelatase subunit ChlD
MLRLRFVAVVTAVLVAAVLIACVDERPRKRRGASGTVENPLEEMLRAPAPAARQEGIAAAILVDTSGSMRDKVKDEAGQSRRKMEIARECVTNLIQQFSDFSEKNPESKVAVGIYEFSSRDRRASCRQVVPLGPPDARVAAQALAQLDPQGGTPIGDAMIQAKRDLDETGMSRRHLLVITDGQNNKGYAPGDVADVMSRQPVEARAALYFVAFNIEASRFNAVKDAGGLVLAADNGRDLRLTLDFILTGKILAERPVTR